MSRRGDFGGGTCRPPPPPSDPRRGARLKSADRGSSAKRPGQHRESEFEEAAAEVRQQRRSATAGSIRRGRNKSRYQSDMTSIFTPNQDRSCRTV